jgi:hypothetical protein
MYVTVLRHEGKEGDPSPPPVPPLRAVQLCQDKLVLTAEGWRIAYKDARAIFRSGHQGRS